MQINNPLLASQMAFLQAGTLAVAETAQTKMRQAVDIADFAVAPNVMANMSLKLEDALSVTDTVTIKQPGDYYIDTTVDLLTGKTVVIGAGVTVNTTANNYNAFLANGVSDVTIINNGTIKGVGGWDDTWSGNSHPNERGVRFVNCTRPALIGGTVVNFGNAQASLEGCTDAAILYATLKGAAGQPGNDTLIADSNFNNGIYITNANGGSFGRHLVAFNKISGAAQLVLREGTADTDVEIFMLAFNHLFDNPSQHAVYNQDENFIAIGNFGQNIQTHFIKIQAADSLRDLRNIICANNTCKTAGGSVYDVSTLQSGKIVDIYCQGTGQNMGGLITVNGGADARTSDHITGTFEVSGDTFSANAAYLFGERLNIDVYIKASNSQQENILNDATNSKIRFRQLDVKNSNRGAFASKANVLISSSTGECDIYDPNIIGDGTIAYGVFSDTSGCVTRILGSRAVITGYNEYSLRATGAITELPASLDLQATIAPMLGMGLITSSLPITYNAQTTSGSNIVPYRRTLADNITVVLTIDITATLNNGTERLANTRVLTISRNGGDVVIDDNFLQNDYISAGFLGAYSFVSAGDDIAMLANSGGSSVYNWTVKVSATSVSE